MFVTTFPKEILETIVSQYFKNSGMLDFNLFLKITNVELRDDEFYIEADIVEETVN